MNLLRRMSGPRLIRDRRIAGAHLAILSVAFSGAALAAAGPARAQQPTAAVPSAAVPSAAAVNRSLDDLAKLFAVAVTDRAFRQSIHDSVAQRFDGDTDVLWKVWTQKPGARSALARVEARRSGTSTLRAQNAVTLLAGRIPRLQIAVPANFASWNPAAYTPLVAFMPTGVEDTTLKTVTAYDAAGRAFQLDAQVAPKRPVIVLGLNERTDDSGALLPAFRAAAKRPSVSAAATSGAPRAAAAATSYQVRMTKVSLVDDNEPWTAGDAEISVKARSKGCSGVEYLDVNWAGLNDSGDTWSGPRVLGNTTCDVVYYWWEDDGTKADFDLSFLSFGLGVKMDNGDDLIGGVQVAHRDFAGATSSAYEWSDLTMWAD